MANGNPIDSIVGNNLREARKAQELSLAALGKLAEISAQQIQKYETGQNRISASTLWKFAGILQISPASFFEDCE